jgi:hypothetical protein
MSYKRSPNDPLTPMLVRIRRPPPSNGLWTIVIGWPSRFPEQHRRAYSDLSIEVGKLTKRAREALR